ncbi:23S ribosomal RNA methyltransferase Erm [Falseniella ignava]|uniref:rRNA adenine N-6-methyltransferase n=1 Tax=Falseniella ignava TaxID=137730 RepID=A0A2I1JVG0_9LACT|nr:23S ribosomal RNA methyltransferase Erm [Falseniella ignava]PKY87336.1 23S ribosomal RNA methyltransferase Erm [Falseniella ignava]
MKRQQIKYTQNFITAKEDIEGILSLTNISQNDLLYEIGSGKGHFTKELCKICKEVTAIEIDTKMCEATRKRVGNQNNLNIINENVLSYNFPHDKDYKIYGNIPYNISTDLVKKIAYETSASDSFLIVEEGFAKRLLDMNRALALILRKDLEISIVKNIPRTIFHPRPCVDSSLIRMKRLNNYMTSRDRQIYEDFVYSWVNKDYRKLFTKNQIRRVKQNVKINDFSQVTLEQFDSIFESYQLFN